MYSSGYSNERTPHGQDVWMGEEDERPNSSQAGGGNFFHQEASFTWNDDCDFEVCNIQWLFLITLSHVPATSSPSLPCWLVSVKAPPK